jgi:CRP-like cAMP-binding protein
VTLAYLLVLVSGTALLAVSIGRDFRAVRGGLVIAGICGTIGWTLRGGYMAAGLMALVGTVNIVQLLVLAFGRRGVRFNDEEAAMAAAALPRMDRPTLRALLNQGLWLHARAGETLIREGEPTPHLFYLSEGEAAIASGGRQVATCPSGHFLGEITVLSGAPATATVTLASAARVWCVSTDALRRFLTANPGVRPVLEAAFVGDMAEKLRLANRRLAAG